MRITLQCLLLTFVVCFQHANAKEPDPSKSGSHSHMFSYGLEFLPASKDAAAHFKATLTNITNNDLEVQVNDKAFHSTLEITSKSEKKIEAFIKRYRELLLTSTWFEPVITIQSKKSITWTVPLTSLLTLHGDEVTHDLLADRQVVSEMVMMVVPKSGSSVSSNATQRSKPITIPTKEDNKSEMATPRKPSD
jgi:hypothetical protein